jgi:transcriptional regulator with XRE-family HTH domain
MQHPKGFPSRLVRLRAEADMTQKELSRLSGVSVPQIARYEIGASKPRMNALVKLARALNVDVSVLEDADDEPEAVEIKMIVEGGPNTLFTLPKAVMDDLENEAERLGVSIEVMLVATLRMGMSLDSENPKRLDEVVAEVAEEYSKMPPL